MGSGRESYLALGRAQALHTRAQVSVQYGQLGDRECGLSQPRRAAVRRPVCMDVHYSPSSRKRSRPVLKLLTKVTQPGSCTQACWPQDYCTPSREWYLQIRIPCLQQVPSSTGSLGIYGGSRVLCVECVWLSPSQNPTAYRAVNGAVSWRGRQIGNSVTDTCGAYRPPTHLCCREITLGTLGHTVL